MQSNLLILAPQVELTAKAAQLSSSRAKRGRCQMPGLEPLPPPRTHHQRPDGPCLICKKNQTHILKSQGQFLGAWGRLGSHSVCVHNGHFRGNKADFWLWNVCWDWMQGCLPPAGGSEPPHGSTHAGEPSASCVSPCWTLTWSVFFLCSSRAEALVRGRAPERAWGRGVGCWVWVWRPRSLLALAE